MTENYDLEQQETKAPENQVNVEKILLDKSNVDEDPITSTIEQSSTSNSSLKKPTNWVDKIGLRINAEIRGIERVPESERHDNSLLSPFLVFLSPNMVISGLSIGSLGPVAYNLDFRTSIIIITIFCIIGSIPVGFFSAFGMRFGIRQQILSRYFTGNIMGRIFALFNVISCIGWNAVNVIPCAQLLNSVGPLPPWAGCLILVGCTCIFAVFGYKTVHLYEKYSWIPNFIVFMIIIAKFSQTHAFNWGEKKSGPTEAGNVLNFISAIFGFTVGWIPSSADYTVYMPANTNPWKVAFAMTTGLSLPAMFTAILGAAIGTSVNLKGSRFEQAYNKNSTGGLIYEILCGDNNNQGYRFIIVVFALGAIANGIPGSYSLSLAIQCIWSQCARVPRIAWCILGNLVALAFSISAYYKFQDTMSNFLSIIAYNVSIYLSISLTEHFIYRRGFSGYDVTDFNNYKTMPVGIAGVVAFCFGICSTVLSMNQTWYQGVIARKIGDNGGDISFEMNIMFAFIGYNLVRPFELKYFGR
ncbi:NCS1 nucleoside transporter [Candida albicans P87]|nr:NCS1 nucleoside transporter [Candida albicans P87]